MPVSVSMWEVGILLWSVLHGCITNNLVDLQQFPTSPYPVNDTRTISANGCNVNRAS